MKKIIALSLLAISISVSANPRELIPQEKEAVQQAIKDTLKDPDSAKFFFGEYLEGKSQVYCGYVNAKNSYDGYVGKKLFSVMLTETGLNNYVALPIGEISSQTVISATCAGAGYPVMVARHMVKIVNKQRKENGLPPLPRGQISE